MMMLLVVDGVLLQHARRLYPLQVSTKKTLEWAYYKEDDEEWKIVDKSILLQQDGGRDDDDDVGVGGAKIPDGIERLIGFEGRPDPASGFYYVQEAYLPKKD
jgi:hypothetical protein